MPVYDYKGQQPTGLVRSNGLDVFNVYSVDHERILFHPEYPRLKVASYNVGGWYIGSGTNIPTEEKSVFVPMQQQILSELDADVCCFQEYWGTMCEDGTLASTVESGIFGHIETTNADTQWNGHAIATKDKAISDYQSIDFEHQYISAPNYQKCYITVGEKQVCLINTHLSTQADPRIPQAEELLAAVANEEYFVLFGDLNTNITCFASEEARTVIGAFLSEGYHAANVSDGRFFISYYPDTTIESGTKALDNIITSPNIKINSAWTNPYKFDANTGKKIDHVPLIAELVIVDE